MPKKNTHEVIYEEDDLGSFGDFADFLKRLKPNPLDFQIYSRVGGNYATWRTSGNNRYTATTAVIQIGVAGWSGAAATSGSVTQAYGYSFGRAPIVVATPWKNPAADIRVVTYPNAGNCRFDWLSTTNQNSVDICWIAIGPRETG